MDDKGKIIPSTLTYVYERGTDTLAKIYAPSGDQLENPTTSNSVGYLELGADNGVYDVQFEIEGVKGKKYTLNFSDVTTLEADVTELKAGFLEISDKATEIDTKVSDLEETTKTVSDKVESFGDLNDRVATAESTIATNAAEIATAKTDIPAALKAEFAQPNGNGMIGKVVQFSDLRTLQPRFDGETVMLQSYIAGKKKGGGLFVGYSGTQTDDGGFIAAGSGFYWHRADLDLNKLTILDFGGQADGVTDDMPAVKRMYEFTLSKFARLLTGGTVSGQTISGGESMSLAIKLVPGVYFMKPWDATTYGSKVPDGASDAGQNPSGYYAAGDFRIEGPQVGSGRQCMVKIISDKTDKPVFLLNHRRLTIHGIDWDGQQTVKQNTTTKMLTGATSMTDYPNLVSNKQPFLENQCPAGLFTHITCMNISNIGGPAFYLKDTLDTTIKQIYSQRTAAPVFQVGWSDPNNQFYGKWDHSTAIFMADCNYSTMMAPAVWAPRSTQGIMQNCWYEHGYIPFDINNGGWELHTICIEDCAKNAVAWNAKYILSIESVPTGNRVDSETQPGADWYSYTTNPDGSPITGWFNGYEAGNAVFQTHGTYLNHPLRYKYLSGVLRAPMYNIAGRTWVNVGSFSSVTVGGMWEVEIHASNYNSVINGPLNVAGGDRTPGKTTIMVQRGSGSAPKVTFYHTGNSAVNDVRYKAPYNDMVSELWVNLGGYTGEYSINVKSTGPTRRETGQPNLFTPSGAQQSADPTGVTSAVGRYSVHNGRAGIGVQEDMVAITTATANDSEIYTDAILRFYKINVAGVVRGLPVYAMRPVFTTQPAAQSVAAGGTLTLTVAADYVRVNNGATPVQWYKDGVAISGATALTYTKANVTSADAGSYKAVAIGEPATNTKDSNSVTVTIT
ncbi:tailspike protein [Pantoea phage Phynn]|nr:tailspike protein [Pantoea phage Phynn]